MPGVGQTLDMGIQAVPGGLHQALGRGGIGDPVTVLGCRLHQRHQHERRRHDPDVLTQPGEPAEALRQRDRPCGQLCGRRASQSVVDGRADDLRAEHIAQCRQGRGQHAEEEQSLAPPQKAPQQRPVCNFLFRSAHRSVL